MCLRISHTPPPSPIPSGHSTSWNSDRKETHYSRQTTVIYIYIYIYIYINIYIYIYTCAPIYPFNTLHYVTPMECTHVETRYPRLDTRFRVELRDNPKKSNGAPLPYCTCDAHARTSIRPRKECVLQGLLNVDRAT